MFFTEHMKLLLLIIMCLSALSAHAALYEGHVEKIKNRYYLTGTKDPKKYTLSGATPIVATYLNKLEAGDFVSIEGNRNGGSETLIVKSINYVGLQKVIGAWITEDMSDCYIFSSYTEFSIARRIGNSCIDPNEDVYNYFVSPSSKKWILLISGQNDSYVGDIQISALNRMEIKLYDSDNGSILRLLSLRKIAQ
jgi:hypothetical protein